MCCHWQDHQQRQTRDPGLLRHGWSVSPVSLSDSADWRQFSHQKFEDGGLPSAIFTNLNTTDRKIMLSFFCEKLEIQL